MNNGLQKIGKVDYDRRFRRILRDIVAIFKRYSKLCSESCGNMIKAFKTKKRQISSLKLWFAARKSMDGAFAKAGRNHDFNISGASDGNSLWCFFLKWIVKYVGQNQIWAESKYTNFVLTLWYHYLVSKVIMIWLYCIVLHVNQHYQFKKSSEMKRKSVD